MEPIFNVFLNEARNKVVLYAAHNVNKLELLGVVNDNIQKVRQFDQKIAKQLYKKRIEELEVAGKQSVYFKNLFKVKTLIL